MQLNFERGHTDGHPLALSCNEVFRSLPRESRLVAAGRGTCRNAAGTLGLHCSCGCGDGPWKDSRQKLPSVHHLLSFLSCLLTNYFVTGLCAQFVAHVCQKTFGHQLSATSCEDMRLGPRSVTRVTFSLFCLCCGTSGFVIGIASLTPVTSLCVLLLA